MIGREAQVQPSRRSFLRQAAVLGAFPLLAVQRTGDRGGTGTHTPGTSPVAFPRTDPDRVRTVVGASHGNIDLVRTLVTEQPSLAKASWDWQLGDWETPLGAASHVGRRDIAELLIAHGARPTIFSAAMLGQIDTVRAYLEADPDLFLLHGPHGISLTRHAEAGGADAADVVGYLHERFGPDPVPFGFEAGEREAARYGGRFRFDAEPPVELVVGVRNGWLMVGAGADPTGRMLPVDGEDDVFHPTGSPAVRLTFHVRDGRTTRLDVTDGPFSGTGERVDG